MAWADEIAEAPNRFWAITQEHTALGANGDIQLSVGPLGEGRWYFGDVWVTLDSNFLSVADLVATYIPSTSAYSYKFCSYALNGSIQYRIYDSVRGFLAYMGSNDYIRVSLALVSGVHSILFRVMGWGVKG
jgi:hypothetical protein